MKLSKDQEVAVGLVIDWYRRFRNDPEQTEQVFSLGGYAGTGKTTCVKEVVKRLNISPLYAAPTGKAALNLARVNEVQATTVHSLIYHYKRPDKKRCDKLFAKVHDKKLPQDQRALAAEALAEEQKPRFELNDESALHRADLLIVDESSMVNEVLYKDLLYFGAPIVALGDPGQLPPVEGNCPFSKQEPDALLTEIHRQARGNPILAMSEKVRKGIPVPVGDQGRFVHARRHLLSTDEYMDLLMEHDVVITGKNKIRMNLNQTIRRAKGFDVQAVIPQRGDVLCCWKNDKDLELFKGMLCTIVEVGREFEDYVELSVLPETSQPDDEPIYVKALLAYFEEYRNPGALQNVAWWRKRGVQEFDYGYCLTVHKAQGSQWENVLFRDDGLFKNWRGKVKERRGLLYTAFTRASKKLTYIS